MALLALLILVTPFVVGLSTSFIVGGDAWHRIAAFVLGFALSICIAWFIGRVDERPWEGVLALALVIGEVSAIRWLRAHR